MDSIGSGGGPLSPDAARIERDALRLRLRAWRRALPPEARAAAADALVQQALRDPRVTNARRVALYRPVGAELDPLPLARALAARGATLYWPKLVGAQMQFLAAALDAPTAPNRHGIAEPVTGDVIDPAQLDLVLLPLVGFSADGQRLGSGAGWYDRCFAFRLQCAAPPWLAGVAYAGQECRLAAAPWDVPLDFILTECDHRDAAASPAGASFDAPHVLEPAR